jgi:hypothetical protein
VRPRGARRPHHPPRRPDARLLRVRIHRSLLLLRPGLPPRHRPPQRPLLLPDPPVADWALGRGRAQRASRPHLHADAPGLADPPQVDQAARTAPSAPQGRERATPRGAITHDHHRGAQLLAQPAGVLHHRPARGQGRDIHVRQSGTSITLPDPPAPSKPLSRQSFQVFANAHLRTLPVFPGLLIASPSPICPFPPTELQRLGHQWL